MTDSKPDPGVFLVKGDVVSVPSFSISINDQGEIDTGGDKGASDDRLEIASKCLDISQEISEKANVVCRKLSAPAEKFIHDN